MERKAIIIGGYDHEKNVPSIGVSQDIAAWRSFLSSPLGGSWRHDEINVIANADAAAVANSVEDASSADYAFVCFSGHGYLTKDKHGFNETKLILRDGVEISERDLNTGRSWCMAIFDCCRKMESEEPAASLESLKESFALRPANEARAIYEQALRRCEKGYVRVYSADVDEGAEDYYSFTRALIDSATDMVREIQEEVLRVDKAVESARPKLGPKQNPVYVGGRRLAHFPFAVCPVKFTG